jgi:serine protease AprX
MFRTFAFLLATIFLILSAKGQEKYWVFLKDKPQSTVQKITPADFLSQRAIDRRLRFGIPIDETDIPVSQIYLDSLRNMGLDVVQKSRWLNAVSVRADSAKLMQLAQCHFISHVQAVKSLKVERHQVLAPFREPQIPMVAAKTMFSFDYGATSDQIELHHGQELHQFGFTGHTMLIAVHDGGFVGAEPSGSFSPLHLNGQIVHTWDFVRGDANVYRVGSHGSRVLSTMAYFSDGFYVGTAPEAKYILFRTEDEQSETRQEEDNWVAAAEAADSMGADLINTSLGYNLFDNPADNYTYNDMDGRTTIISRGAVMAARKGILLCTSAGNEGARPWRFITAPADADSILTVGAVTSIGEPAGFSSEGPTSDGRIKPNVVAQGVASAVISTTGLAYNSGTSFSSPIMCGLVACLWEAFPEENNIEIIKRVERNSSMFEDPNNKIGNGIPDFSRALLDKIVVGPEQIVISPNPFVDRLNFILDEEYRGRLKFKLYSQTGVMLVDAVLTSANNRFRFEGMAYLANGVYTAWLEDDKGRKYVKRVIKQSSNQ